MEKVHFIGIGAQKSGTSWAYTCLYEHPEICIPVKEIHFFSRPRYANGKDWYEAHFKNCKPGVRCGEWSTSYLYSKEAPERIHACYPDAKILAILRNPVDRAYSQYRNTVRSGEIPKTMTFEEYSLEDDSLWKQGLYAEQLDEYFKYFKREQVLVLIYEDIRKDPILFMRRIHEFLGVNPDFVSSMVHTEVNVGRTPAVVGVDRVIHHISEFLRRNGFDRFVHAVRKTGITEKLRHINTVEKAEQKKEKTFDATTYKQRFVDDVSKLSKILNRDMRKEWDI